MADHSQADPRSTLAENQEPPIRKLQTLLQTLPLTTHLHRLSTAILLLGCARAEKVTYDDHVLPIFEQACLNCHNPDKAKGGLDLSSYTGTIKGGSGGKIVEVADTSSTLLAVLRQSIEPIMPPEGDALAAAQIKTLEAWIDGGLLENATSKAKKPQQPKFNPALVKQKSTQDGPPPLPKDLLLEPAIVAARTTAIHSMALSPKAPVLAITGQGQILLYHTSKLNLLGILAFPEGEPVSVKFTPDGRHLIVAGGVAGKSGTTVVFDISTGERLLESGREFDSVLSADLHPDLSQIATGSPSRLLNLWNSADGSRTHSIKKHTDWVTAVDFSDDGILLSSGDRNGGVSVWEAATGNEFHVLRGHQAGITEALFRSDSNLLATASHDGTLRLWEMNGGKEVKKIDAHGGGVLTFAWGRDGSFISAGRDRTAKLWLPDFSPGTTIKNLSDIPTAIALDTEHQRAFIGDYQGQVTVRETKEGKEIGRLNTNPPRIAERLTGLTSTTNSLRRELSSTTQSGEASKRALSELKTALEDLETHYKEATALREKTAQHGTTTEEALKLSTEKIPTLKQQKINALARVEAQRLTLQNQLGHLQESEASVKKLTHQLETVQAAIERTRAEPDEAKRTAFLAREQARLQSIKQKLAQAQEHSRQLTTQISNQKKTVAQSQDHAQRLANQLAQVQQHVESQRQQLAKHRQAHLHSVQTLKHLASQKPSLEKRLDEERARQQDIQAQLAKTRQTISSKQQLIRFWSRAQLKSRIVSRRTDLISAEREIDTLKTQFSESTLESGRLEVELAERRGKRHQLKQATSSIADPVKLKSLRQREASNEREIVELATTLDSLRSQIHDERRRLDEAFRQLHHLRFQLELDEASYASSGKDGN